MQLVKIDFSLSVNNWHGREKKKSYTYGRVFRKFKPQPISTKIIFIELLLQRKFTFIRVYNQVT